MKISKDIVKKLNRIRKLALKKFALKKFKKECLMLPCNICPNFRQYNDGKHDKWTNDYCAVAKKYGLEK